MDHLALTASIKRSPIKTLFIQEGYTVPEWHIRIWMMPQPSMAHALREGGEAYCH